MATTKTLAPTNQTITIAAFQGEQPDFRQVADAEGKLADAVNALNSQKAYTVYAQIQSNESNAVERLKTAWDTLWNATKTATGKTTGLVAISGTMDFPAYSGGSELGSYYYHGVMNLTNKAGTIYMNQYHNKPLYVLLRHTDGTYESNNLALITTGTMVIACNAGRTAVSYANLPASKPASQGAFLQSLYQCVNHGSAAEMTTCCIDGVDLIIQTATAQNVTIRWFYFGTA